MGQSLFALLILSMAIMSFGELKVKYQWKYLDYDFDSTEQKENAINSGIYNRSKCMLYDADKADDGRIFLTTPKHIGSFSPATLVTITNKTGPGGPLLRPYPNWNSHNNTRCNDSMANVIYIQIRCNHLFAMDNGKSDKEQLCNPKLLIFDLKDDKLVKIIPIPSNVATNQTGFGTMAIPFIYIPDGECTRFWDKMIIFISDMEGSGLVVYISSTNHMCRVESDYMKPTDTFFTVGCFNFTHVASTFALTILRDELYYAPMSGNEIYKIKIKTLLECPDKKKANEESKLAIKLSSHTLPITTVGQAIIYTSLQEMSILCTNVCKNSNKSTVIVQDSEQLQSMAGLKYLPSSNTSSLIVTSTRFPNFAFDKLNLDDINIRYAEIDLEVRNNTDLLSPTTCDF